MRLSLFSSAKQLVAERQSFGRVKSPPAARVRGGLLTKPQHAQVAPSTPASRTRNNFNGKSTEALPQGFAPLLDQSALTKPEPLEKQSQSPPDTQHNGPETPITRTFGFTDPKRC